MLRIRIPVLCVSVIFLIYWVGFSRFHSWRIHQLLSLFRCNVIQHKSRHFLDASQLSLKSGMYVADQSTVTDIPDQIANCIHFLLFRRVIFCLDLFCQRMSFSEITCDYLHWQDLDMRTRGLGASPEPEPELRWGDGGWRPSWAANQRPVWRVLTNERPVGSGTDRRGV